MAYTNAVFFVDYESGSDTARTGLTSCVASNPSGSVTRIAKTAHGLVTGAIVDTTLFTAWLNSAWKVTVVDADNFDLDGAVWQATADANGTVTPRGGSSKADAWLTLTSGATAARIQPGDTMRLKASTDETLVGTCDWTQNSPTITLPGAVTATIDNCDSVWTASANVTATANTTTEKEGTASATLAIASGFTTGKIAYRATGTLDLSAYQQVSFWFLGTGNASVFELRLCSDTIGETAVHTFAIPAMSGSTWQALTFDNGAALNSAIQSVSLWALSDPATFTVRLDNIIACKASSAADALTLNSLIGKIHNLKWEASTAYSLNDKRVPTPPARNGWCYKVTTAGTTSGTEPTWPETLGDTVSDGSVVWTCEEVEDTWYPIRSISGTTVTLDGTTSLQNAVSRGYAGATESVATYKREPITIAIGAAAYTINEGGTAAAPMVFSGGWDRTNMTAQSGETWVTNRGGVNTGLAVATGQGFIEVRNYHAVRFSTTGFSLRNSAYKLVNVSAIACGSGVQGATLPGYAELIGCKFCNGDSGVYSLGIHVVMKRCRMENNQASSGGGQEVIGSSAGMSSMTDSEDCYFRNNAGSGVAVGSGRKHVYRRPLFGNNGGEGVNDIYGSVVLLNAGGVSNETTMVAAKTLGYESYTYSWQHNRTVDSHLIVVDGGTIASATDQRHTASGISWKFSITSTSRGLMYPMKQAVARILCASGVTKNVTIWTRRDSTNIKGKLVCRGQQLAGVGYMEVDCEPTINTWVESDPLSITASETGVVEVEFWVYDGVGTTNNFWVDDLAAP